MFNEELVNQSPENSFHFICLDSSNFQLYNTNMYM